MVKVKLLTHLGRAVGVRELEVEADTVSRLLSTLSKQFGAPFDGQVKACKVLVNGTNVAFLIFKQALMNFDVGVASAGALFAVVLANIAAVFLIRMIGKNLD